jgi:hypothetical protein
MKYEKINFKSYAGAMCNVISFATLGNAEINFYVAYALDYLVLLWFSVSEEHFISLVHVCLSFASLITVLQQ